MQHSCVGSSACSPAISIFVAHRFSRSWRYNDDLNLTICILAHECMCNRAMRAADLIGRLCLGHECRTRTLLVHKQCINDRRLYQLSGSPEAERSPRRGREISAAATGTAASVGDRRMMQLGRDRRERVRGVGRSRSFKVCCLAALKVECASCARGVTHGE